MARTLDNFTKVKQVFQFYLNQQADVSVETLFQTALSCAGASEDVFLQQLQLAIDDTTKSMKNILNGAITELMLFYSGRIM